jgi:hypothetical protein
MRWTWGGLTAAAVAVVTVLMSGRESRPARAQAARAAAAPAYTYRQDTTHWLQTADLINQNARRGWEPFQVIPIANANPSADTMQVAVIFRRPAEGAGR